MSLSGFFFLLVFLCSCTTCLKYEKEQLGWNLNENAEASDPLEYWGEWGNHTYHPSPSSWRFPFYMLTLDRYVDGDPTNNEANGTVFEHNWMSNQFRFGGDARGLMNHLDYIQGMGIRAIYLSGSPFINQPWASDGFGPLDFTLLDHHHGQIDDWRALISEAHRREMYIILDNTLATMGDLIAFKDYENETTPFDFSEYDALWKGDRRYLDFDIGNNFNATCKYPAMWDNDGFPLNSSITGQEHGCRESEFDQYGDMAGVGYVPPWQSQLSKFAGVQDRLRLWRSDVLEKIKIFSCMEVAMLDIDGFRVDKALQTPVEELANWSSYQRECAKKYGKENFLIVGEAVGELKFSSVFFGRGNQPDHYYTNQTLAQLSSGEDDRENHIREFGNSALDGAAFHYPTYGAMTRFLGLDGAIGFEGVDFADHWNKLLLTDDMINAETGEFDPRHMFGMTNQDVFRWPSLANGTQRQLLGFFITFLEMPGIPMLMWGEEQEYNILENLSADYIFGRAPMTSSRAWQLHGCYRVGSTGYYDMPFESAVDACRDDSVSLDHRDPSHPVRNLIKRMFELRQTYPVLNDGFKLQTLSVQTHDIYLPGSLGLPSPTGIWSVYRGRTPGVQDFNGGQGNRGVWLVYQNDNKTVNYIFDCLDESDSLISPFPANTTVKNIFYPYDEYTLASSAVTLGIEDSTEINGCLPEIEMQAWGWNAFVPKDTFVVPAPVITKVEPQHDARLLSTASRFEGQSVFVQVQFSREMDCESVIGGITIRSTTSNGEVAQLNQTSVTCETIMPDPARFVGDVGSMWSFSAELTNVHHGVHTYTLGNATTIDGTEFTNAFDRFMFRIGEVDNPMVFPLTANWTTNLLHQDTPGGTLFVSPKAAGADKWRYSLNWGSSYSDWLDYTGSNFSLEQQPWSGTNAQQWTGTHVITQYWSEMSGSSDHVQHADLDQTQSARRWPHVHVQGLWNQFGYDGGLNDLMVQDSEDNWVFDLVSEFPTNVILNVWGINPDGSPDKSMAFGDVDGDGVLDWVPPDSLSFNGVNITTPPALPFLGYRLIANDGNYNYSLQPTGSAWIQLAIYILLALVSVICGISAVTIFMRSFYPLKLNKVGAAEKSVYPGRERLKKTSSLLFTSSSKISSQNIPPRLDEIGQPGQVLANAGETCIRRTILIATLEYEIEDWAIKIKIGGLGVMASLMGRNLGHQDLIWVVPCVGDVEYPVDSIVEPMTVCILEKSYEVSVQYHKVQNITFVLLDAPVFRKQTKAEPYPARMDDMDSAIYYSAWNACIAQAVQRFPAIDLYHINDYHGALAPLHLLPRVIPCCLSLHNAEFQGLWLINNAKKLDEISSVFNLDKKIVTKYVQFGEIFNLLHAGASYLRIHQKGFGAVGVSKKYGKRSFARYPIFWGLTRIGALPNPDPTDTADWNKQLPDLKAIVIDSDQEARRGSLRRQAQEWAGLKVDERAELFVFVGRWSRQKGIDLIADVFPTVLFENENTQLICVGPVIDLYGKFAALKLSKLMEMYPNRVFSKPEFTALPSYIFSGAEFALIPSRDEPFGLVAVEFGRKGALGIGARVGGLGQMPGWWYTIESTTTKHLIAQFKSAIKGALSSCTNTRALMRARSSLQRFPVAQWIEDLEILQNTSIEMQKKVENGHAVGFSSPFGSVSQSRIVHISPITPITTSSSELPSRSESRVASQVGSRAGSPSRQSKENAQHDVPSAPVNDHQIDHSQLLSKRLQSLKLPKKSSSSMSPRPVTPKHCGNIESNLSGISVNQTHDERHRLGNIEEDTDQQDEIAAPNIEGEASSASSGITIPALNDQSSLYRSQAAGTRQSSNLSVDSVIGDQRRFTLQDVDPSFTDPTGIYYRIFDKMLGSLSSGTSENRLCIADFLKRSEKDWFCRFYEVKLGKTEPTSPAPAIYRKSIAHGNWFGRDIDSLSDSTNTDQANQFMLGENYTPPAGLRKLLQYKIGDWPIYSFLLALGQIIAANSYQITLITGENGESASKLYVVASIYLVGSAMWWILFRRVESVYVLSLPFLFYGAAFFVLGLAPYGLTSDVRGWIQNVATGLYAVASASGSLYFALNFGSEGGQPVQSWIFRACVVQGTQQIYVTVLWYWGSYLTNLSAVGVQADSLVTYTWKITAITTPIALILWAIASVLLLGLPEYYRSSPGNVPSFYIFLCRRKVVLWFFVVALLQNYWLSAPYARSWRYLWSSNHAPSWLIAVLVIFYFVFVWAALLWCLGTLSKKHSWLLPIFAIGLGAPRWCQMLWGVSGIGAYLPWAGGSQLGSAIAGRSLWLWLGVLDAIQGVGFGMILLQTLTRFHIAFTLIAAQMLGSVATIAARASAPDSMGPGSVLPNLGLGLEGLAAPVFWIALGCQIAVCIGFFMFFRKEQLWKP